MLRPMIVQRPLPAARLLMPGELVDAASWPNADVLVQTGYIRSPTPLELTQAQRGEEEAVPSAPAPATTPTPPARGRGHS